MLLSHEEARVYAFYDLTREQQRAELEKAIADPQTSGPVIQLMRAVVNAHPKTDRTPNLAMNDSSWPEDEAAMTYKTYLGNVEDDGQEYANEALKRAITHMHGVFDSAADAVRYDAELQRLLSQ